MQDIAIFLLVMIYASYATWAALAKTKVQMVIDDTEITSIPYRFIFIFTVPPLAAGLIVLGGFAIVWIVSEAVHFIIEFFRFVF